MSDPDILLEFTELNGRRVADIGCGRGELVRFLRAQGADAIGIECGEQQLKAARDADPDHADAYVFGMAQDLPLTDRSMDIAAFFYSLHHVPVAHMDQALTETRRVLVPGGQVFFLEPLAQGPMFELDRLIDDETEVRAQAQAALARAGEYGFEHVLTRDYETAYVYGDPQEYVASLLGIDPRRKAQAAKNHAEIEDAFHRLGTKVEGGTSFAQPDRMVVLRKP